MAQQFVYVMQDLGKVVPPKREILKGISLSFFPGAKIGVLGNNGSGKSTLLRIMAGVDKEYTGEAWSAQGIRIGYLPQEPQLDAEKDVLGNVEGAVAETRAILARFDELNMKLAEEMSAEEMEAVLEEHARVQDAIEASNAWELDRSLEIAMDALRLPPGDTDVAKLSGGERRRVALCRVLLEQPDMLLLDEPTNHLDAESVAWLERYLAEFAGTIVCITHDRYFLDNVAEWILELDRGQGIPFKGNYTAWLEQKHARLRAEDKQRSAKQRLISRELDWVRASPKARQAKSKARLSRYEELLEESQRQDRDPSLEIAIPPGPRLGEEVVVCEHLTKAFGDRVLIDELSFRLPRGGIVGIIGANGAGKTTLFRMIAGQEKADQGSIRLGSTVKLAYVDQTRALDEENTVWGEISQGAEVLDLGNRTIHSRAYASSFNFRGPDQQKRIKNLSGGERNRVHLAKTIKSGGNLLLLDEPTNDLDVETLRALEDALVAFPGCVVVISHDRWFLDRIATHMIAFEGGSNVVWFQGNYRDYEADLRRRLGSKADQPRRIKYKRLTRN